jgi:uncharacterized membrane protein
MHLNSSSPVTAFARARSDFMTRLLRANLPTLRKTASYYLVHVTVAALVAYAVTGSSLLALTLSLLEPTVQAFAFFFFTKRPGNAGATDRSRASEMPHALLQHAMGRACGPQLRLCQKVKATAPLCVDSLTRVCPCDGLQSQTLTKWRPHGRPQETT